MRFFKYLQSLISVDSVNSSKSFTLVLSAIIAFMSGVVVCFVLVYDVVTNGYIKSNLEDMGIFMLCMGGYMAGSGVPKIFGDRAHEKYCESRRKACVEPTEEMA